MEFQVGMKVVHSDRTSKLTMDEITKITPTGKIRIKGWPNLLFDKNGTTRTGKWSYHYIRPATNEDLVEFKRQRIIRRLKKFDYNLLTTDELEKLITTIRLTGARTAVSEATK